MMTAAAATAAAMWRTTNTTKIKIDGLSTRSLVSCANERIGERLDAELNGAKIHMDLQDFFYTIWPSSACSSASSLLPHDRRRRRRELARLTSREALLLEWSRVVYSLTVTG